MLTDPPPLKLTRKLFVDSDRLRDVPLPDDGRLVKVAAAIELAMKTEDTNTVRQVCADFLGRASDFYEVSQCSVRVLAARPLRVREHSTTELFGDYHPDTMQIRVWMRTAIRKDITSFGTFLSTLCHEFCHHLDFLKFGFGDSWHTRGFYERTAALYHHARGTMAKKLVWAPLPRQRWRIDWPRTNRNSSHLGSNTLHEKEAR